MFILDLIITFLIKAIFIIVLILGLLITIVGSIFVLQQMALFWWDVDLKEKYILIKNKLKGLRKQNV